MKDFRPIPWWDQIDLPRFPALRHSLDVDAVVVGGGLTGITAALLLKEAGCRVALVERGRVGGIDTGCTTAHLTPVVDASLTDLASTLGQDHAQAVWDAGWAAINQIDELVERFDIDCDFAWVPGFFTPMSALTIRRSQTTISESAMKCRLPRALASTSASSARRRSSARQRCASSIRRSSIRESIFEDC